MREDSDGSNTSCNLIAKGNGVLIVNHTPLIQVQHWLRSSHHVDYGRLYSHLDSSLANVCGESMKKIERFTIEQK